MRFDQAMDNAAYLDRFRLSAGIDYALRLMRIYTDLVGGDPTTALVFIAAAQAQTQHLNRRSADLREGDFVRDELRRSVSLSALARSLGIPVETTRRHIVRLARLGLVERTVRGGVLVTSRQLDHPGIRAAVLENNVNIAKFLADIAGAPQRKIAERPALGDPISSDFEVRSGSSAAQRAHNGEKHDGAQGGDDEAADKTVRAETQ